MQIQKATGDWENYNEDKLSKYLVRIGIEGERLNLVLGEVERQLSAQQDKHMTTKELHDAVSNIISKFSDGIKLNARYTLKHAIYLLGPNGYQFEHFIGQLFAAEGFKVQVGTEMQGKCITHEIDVYARQNDANHFVECKFHNQEGTRSDITVALYTHARFRDLHKAHPEQDHLDVGWLATNTKLTSQALEYAKCVNMHVLNLNLPERNSIFDRVVRYNIFPISSISILEPYLQVLFQHQIYTTQDLEQVTDENLENLPVPLDILQESRSLINNFT